MIIGAARSTTFFSDRGSVRARGSPDVSLRRSRRTVIWIIWVNLVLILTSRTGNHNHARGANLVLIADWSVTVSRVHIYPRDLGMGVISVD